MRGDKIIPFLFPVLMLSVTTVAYLVGMNDGSLPTQQDWDSSPHSGGPWHGWMSTFVYFGFIFGVLGGLSGLAVARQRGYGTQAKLWGVGTLLGVAATALVFHWFGYLID
jgi:hypothetical protein